MATTSLRELIRQRLVDLVPALDGNVWEPQQYDEAVAGGSSGAVLVLGGEPQPTTFGARSMQGTVWAYVPETDGSFTDVDGVNGQIVAALDRVSFQEAPPALFPTDAPLPADQPGLLGGCYALRFAGGVGDVHTGQIHGLGHPLHFRVDGLRWRGYGSDPVLLSLLAWTQQTFPVAQTDPSTWLPANDAPIIYWRVAGGASVDEEWTFDSRWLLVPIQGHVECPDPDQRDVWLSQVTAALAGTSVYGIPLADGTGFLRVKTLKSSSEADPILKGQITLGVRFLHIDPLPPVLPPIDKAELFGDLTAQLVIATGD